MFLSSTVPRTGLTESVFDERSEIHRDARRVWRADTILARLRTETWKMTRLPLLLVDIDGVISVWGWPAAAPLDGRWTLVDGIPHFLATEPARLLRELSDRFELVWCSGWEEKADEHLPALVGLGPLPHLSFGTSSGATRPHWKLAAIDAFAGPLRPLAWVDDDLTPACHDWARSRPGPTLLVTTRPSEGLTVTQAQTLADWARTLPTS